MTTFIQPYFWSLNRGRVPMRATAVPVTPAVTITSSSVATDSVITTPVPHGFLSGDTVTIASHTSTPTINGDRRVTVLSLLTFSIPVTVTIAGSGGTATQAIAAPVLSIADAKLHARLPADVTAEDLSVENWVRTATAQVQNDTSQILRTTTFDIVADRPPLGMDDFLLPFGPIQGVVSVKSYDTDGDLNTMAVADYLVDTVSLPGRIALADSAVWPSDLRIFQPVIIRIVAGYDSLAKIPEPLLQAIRLLVGFYALYREPSVLERNAYDALIAPYQAVCVA